LSFDHSFFTAVKQYTFISLRLILLCLEVTGSSDRLGNSNAAAEVLQFLLAVEFCDFSLYMANYYLIIFGIYSAIFLIQPFSSFGLFSTFLIYHI
jgi:hypothetical protein